MKRHPCLAALLLVVTSHVALAQSSTPASLDRLQVIAAASDVMKQAHYCTLVTIGEDGQPQARVTTLSHGVQSRFNSSSTTSGPDTALPSRY